MKIKSLRKQENKNNGIKWIICNFVEKKLELKIDWLNNGEHSRPRVTSITRYFPGIDNHRSHDRSI